MAGPVAWDPSVDGLQDSRDAEQSVRPMLRRVGESYKDYAERLYGQCRAFQNDLERRHWPIEGAARHLLDVIGGTHCPPPVHDACGPLARALGYLED